MLSELKESQIECSIDTEYDSLALSSIDFVNLVIMIETQYEKEFDDEDLVFAKYKTVQDIIDVIKKMIGGR
jgi:acyl carrier protein